MTDTGFNWGDWAFVQTSSADWNDLPLSDAGTTTADAIDLDVKAACEVSLIISEDDTGAITSDLKVHILGDIDGTNYEETTNSGAWRFDITPVQSDTVYKRFPVDPAEYGKFKLALENRSSQTLTIDARYRTATIPLATS